MDINKLIKLRPFLYHLTDIRNLDNIVSKRMLLSTSKIVNDSDQETKEYFLRERRSGHTAINVDGTTYYIRDQKPISLKVLSRSLTDNWTPGDFINHLNSRVFFWPTLARLERHFNRYEHENPIIIKVSSSLMLQLNQNTEVCNLNSGATRCNTRWNGDAPHRGPDTFLSIKDYKMNPSSVAEVTFPDFCYIPPGFWIGSSPNGEWKEWV